MAKGKWETSVPSSQFSVNLKLLQKYSLKKEKAVCVWSSMKFNPSFVKFNAKKANLYLLWCCGTRITSGFIHISK